MKASLGPSLSNPPCCSRLNAGNVRILWGSNTQGYRLPAIVKWHGSAILPPPCFRMSVGEREVGSTVVPIGRVIDDLMILWSFRIETIHTYLENTIVDAVFSFIREEECLRWSWRNDLRNPLELSVSGRKQGMVSHIAVHRNAANPRPALRSYTQTSISRTFERFRLPFEVMG
jgi:hypothetical protein